MVVRSPIYIVDQIAEVIQRVDNTLFAQIGKHINYTYGPEPLIVKMLKDLTSANLEANKYPLFALVQPIDETTDYSGYEGTITIRRIVIATLTNSLSSPPTRYNETFKPILYPIYTEFLKELVRQKPLIVDNDYRKLTKTKQDIPGVQPAIEKMKDYLDCIEITNLKFTIQTL